MFSFITVTTVKMFNIPMYKIDNNKKLKTWLKKKHFITEKNYLLGIANYLNYIGPISHLLMDFEC